MSTDSNTPPTSPAAPEVVEGGSTTTADGLSLKRYPRAAIILVGLAGATVAGIGISSLRGILAPTLLTLVLTICAAPVRDWLPARGVPRGIATPTIVLVVFGVLAAFVYAIVIALAQFLAMLPTYSDQFAQIGESVARWLGSVGIGQAQIQAIVAGIDPRNIVATVAGALGGVAALTGALVIVLTMMILMAADSAYARVIFGQLREVNPDFIAAITQYTSNVRRYMVVTTLLGIVQGTLNTIALALLGVPSALLWGMLSFLCSFIPNVGYFIALIPPLFFGFLVGGWSTAIVVLVVYAVINAVVQSIVQPRVVGQAVSLSQTVTLFSVLFWAVIIGPIGAILAVPLTLLAKAVLMDADPRARRWQPAVGPTAETRALLSAEVEQERADRRAARTATEPAPPVDEQGSG
ncbi:putative PurR-regulated permease PerM [Pseudonocardia hierapolitana]|uniref:Putative PurR-regulated permease PerM n=1 Tax=Pseudonocardia hierapolitana TaxID=1128676 RepID=A0A561SJN7_9PSEU|nr:AI-2E family transporter [Pseudonocardia hierapolitana]TWF75054.1 putative PurR-regulated permease PerM [Pseudonocardia hierapolitana]